MCVPIHAKPVCGRTGSKSLALYQPGGVARKSDFFFYTSLVHDNIRYGHPAGGGHILNGMLFQYIIIMGNHIQQQVSYSAQTALGVITHLVLGSVDSSLRSRSRIRSDPPVDPFAGQESVMEIEG